MRNNNTPENLLYKEDSLFRLSVLAQLYQSFQEDLPEPAPVEACLMDVHPAVQHLAVAVLKKMGVQSIPALIQVLDDTRKTALRQAAAAALADFGIESAQAIPALCTCLKSDDEDLRWHAGYALAQIGPPAIPALKEMLKFSDHTVLVSTLVSFELMGIPAAEATENIQAFENHPNLYVRMQCFATLVKVTGESSKGLPMLLSLLTEESDPTLSSAYIDKIGMLGNDAQGGKETILKYFSDPSPALRAAAATALARTSRDFSSSEREWLTLLSDPNPDVLAAAVMGIASYGSEASAAIPILEKISLKEPPNLAAKVTAAIKKIICASP